MKFIISIFKRSFHISFLMAFFCLFAHAQETVTGTLLHDNISRAYRLRLPKNFSITESIPLVFNFHGYGSNASQQEFYSNMNPLANAERFAVCYPDGIQSAWNVGWDFGSMADDVGFVSALIDTLVQKYNFNARKVYACGMSNGGYLSYFLACRLPNKIAAVASVTGSMVPVVLPTCEPGRSIPVLEFHGTADDVVPYQGAQGLAAPIDSVIAFWARNNQCPQSPDFELLPNINTTDGSTVEKYTFAPCDENRKVILYKILGGGHTWPGALLQIGVTNRDIQANVEIWNFFKNYTLPNLSSADEITSVDFMLFPNPVAGKLSWTSKLPVSDIQIFSADGLKKFQSTSPAVYEVDVEHLNPGYYIFKGRSGSTVISSPFIKL